MRNQQPEQSDFVLKILSLNLKKFISENLENSFKLQKSLTVKSNKLFNAILNKILKNFMKLHILAIFDKTNWTVAENRRKCYSKEMP